MVTSSRKMLRQRKSQGPKEEVSHRKLAEEVQVVV